MRLKLERLREARNQAGTAGRSGTANVSADPSVPTPFPLPKGLGTNGSGWPNVFPVFPTNSSVREHEFPSVYAAVPAVPNTPTEQRVSTLGWHALNLLAGDPAAWEKELHQWTIAHCVFCDRAWGGVAALHRDYVEWSHATGNIPPATLATFREWIVWQGFTLTGPLVHGLVLAADVEAQENPEAILRLQ
jgi:hypothetical protein